MNDLRRMLRRGDPVLDDASPTAEQMIQMRVRVIEAARESEQRAIHGSPTPWLRFAGGGLVIATSVFLLLIWAVFPTTPEGIPPNPTMAHEQPKERQLQFTTEGGTRIVWTLDPEFKL